MQLLNHSRACLSQGLASASAKQITHHSARLRHDVPILSRSSDSTACRREQARRRVSILSQLFEFLIES
jgi:hypothetical protein